MYELIKILDKYDIISFLETHCGPNEDIHLDSYYIFQSHRKKSPKAVKYRAGITIAIKQNIRKGTCITFLPITHSELPVLKLGKLFFNFEDDIYVCYTYICPAN